MIDENSHPDFRYSWRHPALRGAWARAKNSWTSGNQDADVVLYHVKTMADSFADQFPEKMIRASVLPIVEPTSEFANPAFSGLPIPEFFNKLSYTLANLSMKLLSVPIREFREACHLVLDYKVPQVKNIYGLSPSFLPVPNDYPDSSAFKGFWFGNSKEEISNDLIEFLNAGEPPLLLTFGSMPFKSKFDLQSAIIKVTEKLNTRVIVVKGWGLAQTNRLENHSKVKIVSSAPYEKIFPLVLAVVHHGGIGTTAECLRAGKPFFVCPILYPIGDQKFWGQKAYERGIAVKPAPLKKMTEAEFMIRIEELLTQQELYKNALQMKLQIDSENGIEKTVREIEKMFRQDAGEGACTVV